MTSFQVYQLHPPITAGSQTTLNFHFGRRGIGIEESSETFGADGVFAALVAQAALRADIPRMANGAPAFAAAFSTGSAPLRISSLLPRIGDLLLLPRPALPLAMDDSLRAAIGKGFKKLRYLSPRLFQQICRGQQISKKPLILQQGKVWISQDEAKHLPAPWRQLSNEPVAAWEQRAATQPIWSIEAIPHVALDRVTNASAYYEVGQVQYAPATGLALLVQFVDPTSISLFESLLEQLGASGLGGRRSTGLGGFAVQVAAPLTLDLGQPGTRQVLLSRYLPTPTELPALQSARASYQLTTIGGWMYSPEGGTQRRPRITMVSEGSVVDTAAAAISGQVIDMASQMNSPHPVYRYGLALGLAIPDQQEVHHATA